MLLLGRCRWYKETVPRTETPWKVSWEEKDVPRSFLPFSAFIVAVVFMERNLGNDSHNIHNKASIQLILNVFFQLENFHRKLNIFVPKQNSSLNISTTRIEAVLDYEWESIIQKGFNIYSMRGFYNLWINTYYWIWMKSSVWTWTVWVLY